MQRGPRFVTFMCQRLRLKVKGVHLRPLYDVWVHVSLRSNMRKKKKYVFLRQIMVVVQGKGTSLLP